MKLKHRFLDVPLHIVDRIVGDMMSIDRMKLSTCHSTFAHFDSIEHLSLRLPMNKHMADSLCRWVLQKDPAMLQRLTIVDDPHYVERVHEGEHADIEHLVAVLIAIGYGIQEVVLDSTMFPAEALLPTMLGVRRAVVSGAPFLPLFPLRHCSQLRTLVLDAGLDADDEHGLHHAAVADLGGITDARALETLCIQNHTGYVCLCQLPDLAHTLERLEIIGTEHNSIVVTHTEQCRYMSKMRELVLDSVTAFTSSEVLASMPLLEVLDVSVRHPATDWRHVVHILDEYANFQADLYDAVRDLAHLRVLGCRDICLTHEFRSPTVRTLHMSLYSFLRSVFGGLSLRHVPALDTIVLDGAFACDDIDPHLVRSIADFFEPSMTCALVLKTSPHDNVSIMGEFWLSLAQLLPRVTFRVVDADEL